MSRNIDNKNLLGRNIINKGIGNVVKDINNIKTKYDFNADIGLGNLLIGNDSNGYTSNTLTAGTNISITNTSGGITIASTDTDTNFFQKSGNEISTLATTDNLLLGTTTNTNNRKLLVNGNLESSVSFSGAFISTSGLFDANFHTMISNSIASLLQIGSANNTRILRFYNDGVFHRFSTNANTGDVIVLEDTTQTLTNKTLTDPVINKIKNSNDRVMLEYNSGISRLFLGNTTDNIQMFNAFLVSPKIEDASANNFYNIVASELTSNIDITLPVLSSNDEFVFKDATQTLTSKTLDSPTINTAVSGTAILDEDDLASNSATKLATQQSIKSYVDTLKTKYDFTATVTNGKLLIGNSFGNYSVNNLTAGTGISIINTIGNIIVACTVTDTNFFQKSSSNISALNTSDNLLLGTTSNSNSRKLLVNGTAEITGKLTLGSTLNDLTIPALTDTIAVLNGTQTLLSKTFTTPKINDTSSNHTYNITVSELAADRNILLPVLADNDTFVFENLSQTLKFKSFQNPKIFDSNNVNRYEITSSNISANREINLPTLNSNDTFVFASVIQTLQNKTMSGGSILAATISGSTINNDINGNATTATSINGITTSNIVQLTSTQTLTNKTISNPLLTGSSSGIFRIHDLSLNNTYNIKTEELSSNHSLTIPAITTDTGKFVIDNLVQTLTSKTLQTTQSRNLLSTDNLTTGTDTIVMGNSFDVLQLGQGVFVGIGVSAPRANLDLALNYPNDTSSTSGLATNIFLNTKNETGDSSGVVWKPNFSGYSKTSAYINFEPTGNFFRGELHFGANFTSDTSTAARKVMVIKQSGQYVYGNPITFTPASIGNNWYPLCYWESNASATVGGSALNNGGSQRKYVWTIESTASSFRALGLATNNTDSITDTTGSNFTSIGFFQPFAKSTTYSFTASHRCYSNNNELYNEDKIGLIVESTGQYDSLYIDDISVDNAVPIVDICNSRKSKKVLGVIANFESDEDRREGMDFGYIQVCDKDKNRLYINSIGEGAVWVANTNGNFENGDYIQSSSVAGYGEKQESEFLANYTLAKITMDVDFDILPSGFKTRTLDNNVICVLVGCIYVAG